jgi:sugar-specific transcriptional regulator TrmB
MAERGHRLAASPRAYPAILSPDLVSILQSLGLTWDEVRIYQFLLGSSPALSSAIVRETGHSRSRIYEALRRLVEKGFVREEPTRPIQFHPTPLVEILATAHTGLTKQLAAVKQEQEVALTRDAEVAIPLLAPTKPRDVRVLSGRRACHAEWRRMLAEATSFFWLTGGEHLTNRLAAMPDFLRELRTARDNGISIQLVLPLSPATAHARDTIITLLGPDALELATGATFGPLVSCATERASMEVICQPDDDAHNKGDDVAIQVSSELFADAIAKRRELAESFQRGETVAPYQWLGPDHGAELMLGAVRGAEKEVLVLGAGEWRTDLTREWPRTASIYDDAKSRGVKLQALAVRTENIRADLAPYKPVWDIRIVPWLPVWLTIIDGRELYQAFSHPSLPGSPQFRRSLEPNETQFYGAVFARLWAQGEAI